MMHRDISMFPRKAQKQHLFPAHSCKHLPSFYNCERLQELSDWPSWRPRKPKEVNMSGRKSLRNIHSHRDSQHPEHSAQRASCAPDSRHFSFKPDTTGSVSLMVGSVSSTWFTQFSDWWKKDAKRTRLSWRLWWYSSRSYWFFALFFSCVDAKLVDYAKVFWGHSKMSQHKSVRPTQWTGSQEVKRSINQVIVWEHAASQPWILRIF